MVYAKPAFGGPTKVLRYLGRYTHRIAISNHRLLEFDGERVTFRWKDYAHGGKQRTMTLLGTEFLRRFLGDRRDMALPQLRRCDVCRSQTHRRGTLAVLLLRYLLMLRTTAGHRRAPSTPADLCACPSPERLPAALSAPASGYFSAIAKALGDPTSTFAFVGSLTSACGSSKAAFISHSQRPPQTPAPSF